MSPGAPEPSAALLSAIVRALSGLRFGSIEITVHDGRVTLIERREKVRLTETASPEAGARHPDVAPSPLSGAGPIGPPKNRRGPGPTHDEEDPTGRPEVPPTEQTHDATRTLDGSHRSFDHHPGGGSDSGAGPDPGGAACA
jgi:hypothetical protein